MNIFNVLTLFGGLAMFLYGMRLMGDSLKESSSGKLKVLLEQVTNNPFKAFLLGALVTALIQSSTATIVITSGLVAAGILTIPQSLGIIIGANVGTTVTGQIIRLLDINASGGTSWLQFFQPSTLAPLALIIGIIMIMGMKFKNSKSIGNIMIGFGILFTGLMNMTSAVDSLSETGAFTMLLSSLGSNPIIGYMVGLTVAFILQSSSAAVGILQAFSLSGGLTFNAVYAVIVGIYLGDCVTTAIVCWIGASADQKRVGVVNIAYNLFKSAVVLIGVFVLNQLGLLGNIWSMVVNPGSIANANTIFNLIPAFMAFPFLGLLQKLSYKIVKDDGESVSQYQEKLDALNPQFFATPALALRSCYDLLLEMFVISRENLTYGIELLNHYDEKIFAEIMTKEEAVDLFAEHLTHYMGAMAANELAEEHTIILNAYYKIVHEFERLGDHAVNVAEIAKNMAEQDIAFSDVAIQELTILVDLINQVLELTRQTFEKRDIEAAYAIEPLEEVVDDMVKVLKTTHLERLAKGECDIDSGVGFMELLTDLERISDNCSNVGIATVDRVGPELKKSQDAYLRDLYASHTEKFNEDYKRASESYMKRLQDISKSQ